MNLKPLPGRYLRRVGSAAFEDVIIEKDTPAVRLIGTETSAEDYRIVESGGDLLIQRNTGSKASPSWTDVAKRDHSDGRWIFTGTMTVSGQLTNAEPIISSFNSAQHTHANAAGGGTLPRTALRSTTVSASGTISNAAVGHSFRVTLETHAFEANLGYNKPSGYVMVCEPNPNTNSHPDDPRVGAIVVAAGTTNNINWVVQYRHLTTS